MVSNINVKICCISLLFMIINEFHFFVLDCCWTKSNSKTLSFVYCPYEIGLKVARFMYLEMSFVVIWMSLAWTQIYLIYFNLSCNNESFHPLK